MSRRRAIDPLLDAVIAKLPASGSPFPAEARKAWLDMVSTAFDVAYGVIGPPPPAPIDPAVKAHTEQLIARMAGPKAA